MVCAAGRSGAVVLVLFLFCVALGHFVLGLALLFVFMFLGVFSVQFGIVVIPLGRRELVYLLLLHLFILHVLISVLFLLLLVSGVGCIL